MITREAFEESLSDPLLYWSGKSNDEIKSLLGEDSSAMVAFDQRNPHHCYDLFMHSLHTVDALDKSSSANLRVAAFFHDIGKPRVAMEKQGRLVFYGHAAKSAEIADPILEQIGYSPDERKLICFYVEHHDDFINWVLPGDKYNRSNPYLKPITRANVISHINDSNNNPEGCAISINDWLELVMLCEADADSQSWHVFSNGQLVDSKARKLNRLEKIASILSAIINN